jgi:hypothetical protein
MTTKLARLEPVPLRAIWPHEALDFSPWLADNLEALSEALGIDLELQQAEAAVGDFSLDILARDLATDRPVIIENQLTHTDHDHLGKLITYAAGQDAAVIVWICEQMREEHRQALDWLNHVTDVNVHFFGVVIEVLRIGESLPAYNFKTVVFPNEWQKTQKKATKTNTTRGEAYRAYFQPLLDELRARRFTNAKTAQAQNWYHFSAGTTGIAYGHSFAHGNQVRVELYIDVGDGAQNEAILNELDQHRPAIEHELGQLSWERLEGKRACRVALYRTGSIASDERNLTEVREWTINNLLRFKTVLGPYLKSLTL